MCGTSIGALNAALYAQDDVAALARVWGGIAARRVLVPVPPVARALALLADVAALRRDPLPRKVGDAVRGVLDGLGLFPLERFATLLGALEAQPVRALLDAELDPARLVRSIVISATNVTRTSSDTFFRFSGADAASRSAAFGRRDAAHALDATNYRDAVRASAAVPGAFAPVMVRTGNVTDAYVDGGVANDTPVSGAIEAGADEITVVFTMPPPPTGAAMPARNLVEVAAESFAVIQARLLEADMRDVERVNTALAAGARLAARRVALRTIRPAQALGVAFFGFDDQRAIDDVFALGSADGAAAAGGSECVAPES